MNILNIIDEIEKVDADVYDRLNPRRKALKAFTGLGGKIALSALPFALGSMFNKAYAQSSSKEQVVEVLKFALLLEHLEADFYTRALTFSSLIPNATARMAITTIKDHEVAHVKFLEDTLAALGASSAGIRPNFQNSNYTKNFASVFSDYATFLTVAQAFEDAGVRAYKGQAGNLMGFMNGDVLTAALNIHSVEARHAAHIRYMRKGIGANVKPWITGNDGAGAPAAIYAGEQADTQAEIKITGINGMAISANIATESFDEPLDKAAVTAIVTPFLTN